MSETAVATTTETTQQAPAAGFLGGDSQPQPTQSAPFSLFSESIYKDGKFQEGWTQPFQDKYPSAAGKLGQVKDPEGFLKTFDHYVKVASGRELKGLPTEAWSETERADFRNAFQVPETPEQYKFKPENLGKDVHWPEDTTAAVKFLHDNHVPAPVAEGLGKMFAEHLKGQTEHSLAKFESRIDDLSKQSEERFKKEWGADYDGKREANKAFIKSQFTEQELADPILRAALSHPKIVDIVNARRESMREGKIPGTNAELAAGTSLSPRQQGRELAKTAEYRAGDPAVVKRVNDLYALDAQQQRQRAGR